MNDRRIALTVIVPVYNVAPYIEKCARSLFEQTLDDLEILFVDDCSPDKSVEIIKSVLEEYPERKSLTRIIKMPSNGGQAAVGRAGGNEAPRGYFIERDGDALVGAQVENDVYDEAIRTGADIVVCDEIEELSTGQRLKPAGNLPENGKQLMKNWYKNTIGLFCHNKLVKRSLYTDNDILPWVDLNMWEDNGLFARLFYHAGKVTQISGKAFYHYNRTNVNAMTAGYGIKQVEQMIGIADNIEKFYESKPDVEDYRKSIDAFKYLARLNLITDSFSNYKRFKNTFPESSYIAAELDPAAFSTKGRMRFRMVKNGLAPLFIVLFKVRNFILKSR